MEIDKVELLQEQQFYVKYKDGNKMYVPLAPLNRNYQEVEVWYKEQKKKPFKFNFKKGVVV